MTDKPFSAAIDNNIGVSAIVRFIWLRYASVRDIYSLHHLATSSAESLGP
jgi:hypothetical protein